MADRVKIGILNDMADLAELGGDDDDTQAMARRDIAFWIEREVSALKTAGRIPAAVEIVHAYGLGLPSGTAEAVENAYNQLVNDGATLIVGPAIGDNALIATPLAEKLRVPTLNWAGAERARGRYTFQLQVGSHEDESLVIARHMASLGCRRLGVVFDISPIGTRHLRYLSSEAQALGIEIVAAEGIGPIAGDEDETETSAAIDKVLSGQPDGFVYLGLGLGAPQVAARLIEHDWDGPRIMNTAGLRGYHGDFATRCEGWRYVDLRCDGNRTLKSLLAELDAPLRDASAIARGHDLGRLVAEAIARAPDPSREGLRLGLEQVKWLPAAMGEEGTLLGFGVQDRGALHGRYLVIRRWEGGESLPVAA